MLRGWLARKKTPQPIRAGEVIFLGDQDGPSERDLKQQLAVLFESIPTVNSAYLAVVSYEGACERSVALCLSGVPEGARPQIAQEVGNVFASIFNQKEHLDIMFPNASQQARLGEVCQAFFSR